MTPSQVGISIPSRGCLPRIISTRRFPRLRTIRQRTRRKASRTQRLSATCSVTRPWSARLFSRTRARGASGSTRGSMAKSQAAFNSAANPYTSSRSAREMTSRSLLSKSLWTPSSRRSSPLPPPLRRVPPMRSSDCSAPRGVDCIGVRDRTG